MTIKVNLLPTERKRLTFDPLTFLLVVLVIGCTIGFVFYGYSLQKKIGDKKVAVADIDNQIQQLEQSIPVIDDLKTQISKLENEIKVIESLGYDPVRYGNLLAEIGRVLPDNVWLTNLSVEPSTATITMSGTAVQSGERAPLATIAGLMSQMGESKILSDASLSSTSQTNPDGVNGVGFTFQIEAHYNPDVAAGLADNAAPAKAANDSDETEP
jgi:Tfp pilus assembly protein PilN